MTTHIHRISILFGTAAVALLVVLASQRGLSLPQAEAASLPVARQGLADLPSEARTAIARILERSNESGHALSTELGFQWIQQAKLTASDGAESSIFGSAIAISGETIVVGAVGDNADQGAAYVFTRPAGGWATMTETAKLTASDGVAADWFGWSAAIDGDAIVVGSLGGTYGASAKPGSAYVFVKPAGGWVDMTQTAKLTASDGVANDQFGYSTVIKGDTIAVGAIFVSSTYVFVRPGGGWITSTQTAKLTSTALPATERFGFSVGMSGDTMIAGAVGISSTVDSAYVFVKPGGGWITTTQTAKLTASDGAIGDGFGWSIAFDGNTAAIGAPNDANGANNQQGSAYVFVKPGGGWITSTQTAKLTASDGAAIDLFGWSVALSGDRVVVGSVHDNVDVNNDQGSAYIFDKPTGGWVDMTETIKLTASDGAAGDGFGWSIAFAGNTLAVGAYTDDVNAANQGSAYIFGLNTPAQIYLPLVVR
jgi:hypothetical protein